MFSSADFSQSSISAREMPRANKGNNVSGGRTATIYTSTKCKKIKYIYIFWGLKYKHTARLKSLFRSRRWTAIARL